MPDLDALSREELYALIRAQAAQIRHLAAQVADLTARVQAAEERAAQAEQKAKAPRTKANVPVREDRGPRQARAQGAARRRDVATHTVTHAADTCPDCGHALTGGSEHRRRQVIDLPVTPATITDHIILARWCGVCAKRVLPALTPADFGVVGHHRVGLRLMSTIATLAITHRLPLAQIQAHLADQYALTLSVGELAAILQTVAALGTAERDRLLAAIRQSPVVHGDETGWREAGQHGWLWLLRTGDTCVITHDASRGGAVPRALLGEDFPGVLVTDFYAAYGTVICRRQRCWVHLLRDLDALQAAHPADVGVRRWVRQVRALYAAARQIVARPGYADRPEAARIAVRQRCEAMALRLAAPHLDRDVPQRVLAKRLRDFQTELFVFVEDPAVPAHNNDAERAFRPAVIARKISGGTRSAHGSTTRATLMSLLTTCRLRDLSPRAALTRLLLGQSMFATA